MTTTVECLSLTLTLSVVNRRKVIVAVAVVAVAVVAVAAGVAAAAVVTDAAVVVEKGIEEA